MEEKLIKICELNKDFDMYSNNTFRLHSIAKYFIKINNIEHLKEIVSILKEYKAKWFVIGNGSNVILPSYYDGVIIKLEGLLFLITGIISSAVSSVTSNVYSPSSASTITAVFAGRIPVTSSNTTLASPTSDIT